MYFLEGNGVSVENSRIEYWLRSILNHVGSEAQVILVGTHLGLHANSTPSFSWKIDDPSCTPDFVQEASDKVEKVVVR